MSHRSYFTHPQRHDFFIRKLTGDLDSDAAWSRQEAAYIIKTVRHNIAASRNKAYFEEVVQRSISLVQTALRKAWESDIINYERLALSDYQTGMADFAMLMTQGRTNLFFDGTFATHFNWGDAEFSAHIAPSPSQGLNKLQIYIAGGVMRSFDDFFCRAFCHKSFFSWSIVDNVVWDGCACFFAAKQDCYLKPLRRYWNYEPNMSVFIEDALLGETPFLGVETNYYSGIPIGDRERINAAALASNIAFYWVVAHEVAHYRRGHFHAMQAHPEWFGITGASLDGVEHLRMHEGGERHSTVVDDLVSRQIEWDADRVAAETIVDIFFHPDQVLKLPSYCTDKPKWLLRLVITAMTGSALLFDRVSQFTGTSAKYPSGLARIIGIIIASCRRFHQTVEDSPVTDRKIREFAKIESSKDAVLFASEVSMEVLRDLLLMTEILENENIEGLEGSVYQLPLDDDAGAVEYVHYMMLNTMFKSPLWPAFQNLRDAASVPRGRWSTGIFEEVKNYLQTETEHPLSITLTRYTRELHTLHERKLAAVKRQRG